MSRGRIVSSESSGATGVADVAGVVEAEGVADESTVGLGVGCGFIIRR